MCGLVEREKWLVTEGLEGHFMYGFIEREMGCHRLAWGREMTRSDLHFKSFILAAVLWADCRRHELRP